jgi:hypothetical protein
MRLPNARRNNLFNLNNSQQAGSTPKRAADQTIVSSRSKIKGLLKSAIIAIHHAHHTDKNTPKSAVFILCEHFSPRPAHNYDRQKTTKTPNRHTMHRTRWKSGSTPNRAPYTPF